MNWGMVLTLFVGAALVWLAVAFLARILYIVIKEWLEERMAQRPRFHKP